MCVESTLKLRVELQQLATVPKIAERIGVVVSKKLGRFPKMLVSLRYLSLQLLLVQNTYLQGTELRRGCKTAIKLMPVVSKLTAS